ncbi:MAG: hypothetical protein F8N39_00090 [Clostridiaceae bacterium]|nr:hypothetical protein [Clostridiaceae bacterium]
MKNKWKTIGISGVLFGAILSRWETNKYGENGSLLVGICTFVIIILILILSASKTKKYLGTFMVSLMFSPFIISILGMYRNNPYMILGGIVLFLILGEVMTKKILPWMKKSGKFKD